MIISQTFYQNNQTLIALACFKQNQTDKSAQRQLQKKAIRQLLSLCMTDKFGGYQLDEACHPYQIIQKNKPSFFVSFSHSGNKVALIISPTPCGIDIEINPISYHVAERFFHPNELDYIASFANNEKSTVIKQLWQIKECMVKLRNTTLSQLISQDMTEYDKVITGSVHQWVDYPSADGTCYLLWQDHQTIAIQQTNT